jgi:putative transposase
MIVERFGLSERRACQITGQHRSTQRHRPVGGGGREDALRARLRKLSGEHPRWGYRLAWGAVREEGWAVNRKKIQRLWREEGLRVPQRKRKRLRLGESTVPAKRLRAERPNHVWALDFQFDTTVDGRTLKLLHVVDEHTREALAIRVARSIDADHAVRVLDQIVRERGTAPELVRMDNGPEMTANALRDWCRVRGPSAASSSRAPRGRTRSWSRSAPASATRCSRSRHSTPCSRRKRSSLTGQPSTTTGGHTAVSAGDRRRPMPLNRYVRFA